MKRIEVLLRYFLPLYLIFFTPYANAQNEAIPYKLDAKMAKEILISIDDEFKDIIPPVHYDGLSPYKPTFYLLSTVFDRDAHDYWAVNPWTGDVWDLWSCEKEQTPASLKLQAKIRKRFTADEITQYDRLSALKPHCWN